MSEVNMTVHTFRIGTDKESAIKVLEEASEVRAAWQEYDRWLGIDIVEKYRIEEQTMFADEIADCIQACTNLADRYGIDLQTAMERCEKRNRERGRYE